MPELPEVETTRRGLAPHVEGQRITQVQVFEPRLRWPVDPGLAQVLTGLTVARLERRAKYLLFHLGTGALMVHLGMSGSLQLKHPPFERLRHDHVLLALGSGAVLVFNDPRRFGSMHWLGGAPEDHRLLAHLGPEPLSPAFDGAYLAAQAKGRSAPVKAFLMDGSVVVGVGNIYATEALFLAGIHPRRPARRISAARYDRLATEVRTVLTQAIAAGGTTLRDFVDGSGRPGYFQQTLHAYGRAGQPCPRCTTPLKGERLAQRATVFCPRCQR